MLAQAAKSMTWLACLICFEQLGISVDMPTENYTKRECSLTIKVENRECNPATLAGRVRPAENSLKALTGKR